jgi:hypothetical protein
MLTKPVVVGLLAAGTITAAAGGAYFAVRQNVAERRVAEQVAAPLPVAASAGTEAPVTETEAIVTPAPDRLDQPAPEKVAPAEPAPVEAERSRKVEAPAPSRPSPRAARRSPTAVRSTREPAASTPARARPEPPVSPEAPAAVAVEPPTPPIETVPLPPPPPEREFVEVVVPASSVIGLQVETSLSSERAKVEDRVDARVTRDVMAEGRVAIPAGARMIGSVTLVERGGKIKERARLGVRFHTIVFADGTEARVHAEPIYREGDPPSGESARKIGGAAVGGAILGAILGGGKGAVLGGAAGAAGGTAATMAGGRNPASLSAGTVVTVRLTEPVTLDVEKR